MSHPLTHLHISEVGLSPCGHDTQGEDSSGFGNIIKCLHHLLLILVFIKNELVGRHNKYPCLWISVSNGERGPCGAWQRVSPHRFEKKVLLFDLRQLLQGQVFIFLIGGDDDVVGVNKPCYPVVGGLQKRLPIAKKIDELFWFVMCAGRPELKPHPTCKYHAIVVVVHILEGCSKSQ